MEEPPGPSDNGRAPPENGIPYTAALSAYLGVEQGGTEEEQGAELPLVCTACTRVLPSRDMAFLHAVLSHSLPHCAKCAVAFHSVSDYQSHADGCDGTSVCTYCHVDQLEEDHVTAFHRIFTGTLSADLNAGREVTGGKVAQTNENSNSVTNDMKFCVGSVVTEENGNLRCRLCQNVCSSGNIFQHLLEHHRVTLGHLATLIPKGSPLMALCAGEISLNGVKDEAECCHVCYQAYTDEATEKTHAVLCEGHWYCHQCDVTFPTQESLDFHASEHELHTCCQMDFTSEEELADHSLKCHGAQECGWCGVQISAEEVQTHVSDAHSLDSQLGQGTDSGAYLGVAVLTEAATDEEHHLLCGLCGHDFRGAGVSQAAFLHLVQAHNLTVSCALRWMSSGQCRQLWASFSAESEPDPLPVKVEVEVHEWSSCDEENKPGVQSEAEFEPELNPNSIECVAASESDVEPDPLCCELCAETISDTHSLLTHLETHEFPRRPLPVSCSHCKRQFGHPGQLRDHLTRIHSQNLGFSCPFCLVRMDRRNDMRSHVVTEHEETHICEELGFKCRFCPNLFWEREECERHALAAHQDCMSDFLRCPHCPSAFFLSKVCLDLHLASLHGSEGVTGVAFKCKSCLTVLPTLHEMHQHASSRHTNSFLWRCCECGLLLKTRVLLDRHLRRVHRHFGGAFRCRICGRGFPSRRACHVHRHRRHTIHATPPSTLTTTTQPQPATTDSQHDSMPVSVPQPPDSPPSPPSPPSSPHSDSSPPSSPQNHHPGFGCRLCPMRFPSKNERKTHYTTDHVGQDPYRCSDCGKGFASKSGMYGHRQLHTGSGKSTCQFCGKEFTRRDSYNEHLLIHVGPRHKCPHCPKEFVQRSNLVRHVRIHTGEKPYQCTHCDKRFSDKGACNSHIRVHTREEVCSCPYCGQTFSKKQKLKYHIRKHTGEDLVLCDLCGKAFTNSFAMKEHRQTHTQGPTATCSQCEHTFTTERSLRRHMYVAHGEREEGAPGAAPRSKPKRTPPNPVQCSMCGKVYSEVRYARRHIWKAHFLAPGDPRASDIIVTVVKEEMMEQGAEQEGEQEPGGSTAKGGKKTMEQVLKNLEALRKGEEAGEVVTRGAKSRKKRSPSKKGGH